MNPKKPIETLILTLRGQKVILDADLAEVYGVATKRFNEAFKRNRERFPDDFAFQLTVKEWNGLRSQIVTSNLEDVPGEGIVPNWSQFATASSDASSGMRSQIATAFRRNIRHRPWAFTEHGALMAANILRSKRAVEMSVFVIRAFVRAREQLAANASILKRLAEIDKTLLEHDSSLRAIWTRLQPLLAPPPEPLRKRIKGFSQRED
jgi:hypothetical protein